MSSTATDKNGVVRLLDDNVQSIRYDVIADSSFGSPDSEYTGYSASGFWHTQGDLDPTHIPFKATWAQEGEGPASVDRGSLDRMPARILTVATRADVVIMDADTLEVWMRFRVGLYTPPALGGLAGLPSTRVTDIAFVGGRLFMFTTDGLRVADFRNDVGLLHTADGTYTSRSSISAQDGGLFHRNEDTYLDGTVSPSVKLLATPCLCGAAAQTSGGRVLRGTAGAVSSRSEMSAVAVGHAGGITALTYEAIGSTTILPESVAHPCSKAIPTAWEVVDDQSGDAYSSVVSDYAYGATNWVSLGLQVGDTFSDAGSTYKVVEISQVYPGLSISLDASFLIGHSGSSYSLSRNITAITLAADMSLYVADGAGRVAVRRTPDWFVATTSVAPSQLYSDMKFIGDSSTLSVAVNRVNALALAGSDLLAATDLGVFRATDAQLSSGANIQMHYSTASPTSQALYPVLWGSESNVAAVAVDPESGHILLAVTDFESVVTEVDPATHKSVRYFDAVGRVTSIATYRNPKGPPDNIEAI